MTGFKLFSIPILFFTIIGASAYASAQVESYAKTGLYLALKIPHNSPLGDDFDGKRLLAGPRDAILIPNIKGDYGLGAGVGVRWRQVAMEFSYLRSSLDVTFQQGIGKAIYHMVNWDIRRFYNLDRPTQPYWVLGMCIPWLIVEQGSGSRSSVGDGVFNGIGLDAGLGFAFYLHPKVAWRAEVVYRWIGYFSVEGVAGERENPEEILSGSSLDFVVDLTWAF